MNGSSSAVVLVRLRCSQLRGSGDSSSAQQFVVVQTLHISPVLCHCKVAAGAGRCNIAVVYFITKCYMVYMYSVKLTTSCPLNAA
jgi:hypothetical protein